MEVEGILPGGLGTNRQRQGFEAIHRRLYSTCHGEGAVPIEELIFLFLSSETVPTGASTTSSSSTSSSSSSTSSTEVAELSFTIPAL